MGQSQQQDKHIIVRATHGVITNESPVYGPRIGGSLKQLPLFLSRLLWTGQS